MWIEIPKGKIKLAELINSTLIQRIIYSESSLTLVYHFNDGDYVQETFKNSEDIEKRYEEIKTILIKKPEIELF